MIDAVSGWPGIDTTVHGHLVDRSRIDGVDFYVGDELGHLHLDGSIHLATRPDLRRAMIAEGVARPFRFGSLLTVSVTTIACREDVTPDRRAVR